MYNTCTSGLRRTILSSSESRMYTSYVYVYAVDIAMQVGGVV